MTDGDTASNRSPDPNHLTVHLRAFIDVGERAGAGATRAIHDEGIANRE